MRIFAFLRGIIILFFALISVSTAFANCQAVTPATTERIYMGTTDVPASTPVGTDVTRVGSEVTNKAMFVNCGDGGGNSYYYYKMVYYGAQLTYGSSTYRTNIPGIGLRIGTEYPFTDPAYPVKATANTINFGNTIWFHLVKTGGNLTPGTYYLTAGEAGRMTADSAGNQIAVDFILDGGVVNILPSNCTINYGQSISVHFNDTDRDDLTNSYLSAPASNTVTKNIPFSCDDNDTHQFQASLVFDGANWSGSDTVKTSNSNVGVNVLWNGQMMTAGKRINFSFGSYGSSTMSFTMVKNSGVTNDQVSTGSFTASATLILNTP